MKKLTSIMTLCTILSPIFCNGAGLDDMAPPLVLDYDRRVNKTPRVFEIQGMQDFASVWLTTPPNLVHPTVLNFVVQLQTVEALLDGKKFADVPPSRCTVRGYATPNANLVIVTNDWLGNMPKINYNSSAYPTNHTVGGGGTAVPASVTFYGQQAEQIHGMTALDNLRSWSATVRTRDGWPFGVSCIIDESPGWRVPKRVTLRVTSHTRLQMKYGDKPAFYPQGGELITTTEDDYDVESGTGMLGPQTRTMVCSKAVVGTWATCGSLDLRGRGGRGTIRISHTHPDVDVRLGGTLIDRWPGETIVRQVAPQPTVSLLSSAPVTARSTSPGVYRVSLYVEMRYQ